MSNVIEFRPPDGLTQDECNDMMARMRPVMETLCGVAGRSADITTRRSENGTLYVSVELDDSSYVLSRYRRRYILRHGTELVAAAGTLEDVLAVARQSGA